MSNEDNGECSQVVDVFPSSELNVDVNSVHEKQQFKCKYCKKGFKFYSLLLKHLPTHTGERQFACKSCPKKFSRALHLQEHERNHTGERPFACKSCPNKFKRLSNLKRHERTHTGERPFACKYCPKKFSRASHLQEHEHTHTGERPFACKYCPKKFTRASDLNRHVRTLHSRDESTSNNGDVYESIILNDNEPVINITDDKNPFVCKYCPLTFNKKKALAIHENHTH